MEEDELKRLVSEGEIRAFRDEDKMKFKKSDIDGLKKGRMTEPTIILPSGEPDDSSEDSEVLLVEEDTSETLLDIDDLESEASSASVPTVDFSSSDFDDSSASETITEELTFEEDSGSYVLESSDDVLIDSSSDMMDSSSMMSTSDILESSDIMDTSSDLIDIEDGDIGADTFIDTDTGLQTEPLDMDMDMDMDLDSDIGSMDDSLDHQTVAVQDDDMTTSPIDMDSDMPGARSTRPIMYAASPAAPISPVISGVLVASTLCMLFSGALILNTVRGVDTPVTGFWTDFMFQFAPSHFCYNKRTKKVDEKLLRKRLKWRQNIREGKRSR